MSLSATAQRDMTNVGKGPNSQRLSVLLGQIQDDVCDNNKNGSQW